MRASQIIQCLKKQMFRALFLVLLTALGNTDGAVAATLGAEPLSTVPLRAEQTATEQLDRFIKEVTSAAGRFSQYTVGPQGQTKPRQTGNFAFKRPGQFKWDVLLPYQQLVLSDGKSLFQFDPDLNQVIERPVSKAIGSSPAAILFGAGNIEQAFDLQALPNEEGIAWLRAKPKNAEAGFVHVELGFSQGLPARIILLDAFGQTTRVDLTDFVRNPPFAQTYFKFLPPQGADVVKSQ
jgi:outer membrane lipoprotein carrier protein